LSIDLVGLAAGENDPLEYGSAIDDQPVVAGAEGDRGATGAADRPAIPHRVVRVVLEDDAVPPRCPFHRSRRNS
jgi:hypothetical protein